MADDMALGYVMGQDSNNNGGGNGMFGGDGWWAIILFAMIFGWGRGGFGGGGMFGGGGGNPVTTADLCSQFNFNDLQNSVRGIQQGICDSTYALNNSIMGGFHGVDNAICTLGYQVQQGFNTLGYQQKDCCCETQRLIERGFCDIGNHINTQTRDLIDNQNANTRQIMDFLVNSKIEKLQAENQSLRFEASQLTQNSAIRAAIDASTAEIIRRTGNECPVPAYVVPNPNCCYGNPVGVSYGNFGGYGYGRDGGCGCGC